MTVTILYCPFCAVAIDRRSPAVPVVLDGETIQEALYRQLDGEAGVIEAKVVSHLERRHPFRFWLYRRGLLGLRRSA